MRGSVFHRQQQMTSEPMPSEPTTPQPMTSMAPESSGKGMPDEALARKDGVAGLLEEKQALLQSRIAGAGASGAGPDAVDAHDAMVAAVSGHLAISATLLLPAARRRLPRGSSSVHELSREGRRLQSELMTLQGRLHGDNASRQTSTAQLRDHVAEQVEHYCATEMSLARQLDEVLSPEQARRLVRSWSSAARHAPTRPHPYAVHTRGVGHLVLLGDALWDNALDLMDNRVVPSERPPRQARPLTTWGRYLTGTTDFEAPDMRDVDRAERT